MPTRIDVQLHCAGFANADNCSGIHSAASAACDSRAAGGLGRVHMAFCWLCLHRYLVNLAFQLASGGLSVQYLYVITDDS